MIFTKYKERVRVIRAVKNKKYVAGKYTSARAPLVPKYTNRIFGSPEESGRCGAEVTRQWRFDCTEISATMRQLFLPQISC